MGLLTGTWLKQFVIKERASLDRRMIGIQSELDKVKNDKEKQQRMMTAQQNNVNMMMRNQLQEGIFQAADFFGVNVSNPGALMGTNFQDPTVQQNLQQFQMAQQQLQYNFANAQSIWQNQFNMINEMTMAELTQRESALAQEMQSVKNSYTLLENKEKLADQMVQRGAKDFAPGQQG